MEDKLIIDWTNMPTYNTIMALFVGIALISLAHTGKNLVEKRNIHPQGWAMNFAVLGVVLTITGAHMTLTWPLAKYFPFDNILFGEPSLALGVLLLLTAIYFWKNKELIKSSVNPLKLIAQDFSSLNILLYGLSLMLVSIFFAGVDFQFFAAPKEEPISGNFAAYPWLEAWGLSLIFLGIALCSFMTTIFFKKSQEDHFTVGWTEKLGYTVFLLTGWFMLFFGAMNYYTHIGLVLNTMK